MRSHGRMRQQMKPINWSLTQEIRGQRQHPYPRYPLRCVSNILPQTTSCWCQGIARCLDRPAQPPWAARHILVCTLLCASKSAKPSAAMCSRRCIQQRTPAVMKLLQSSILGQTLQRARHQSALAALQQTQYCCGQVVEWKHASCCIMLEKAVLALSLNPDVLNQVQDIYL